MVKLGGGELLRAEANANLFWQKREDLTDHVLEKLPPDALGTVWKRGLPFVWVFVCPRTDLHVLCSLPEILALEWGSRSFLFVQIVGLQVGL